MYKIYIFMQKKDDKDSGAHCMNILILYMVEKTHTGPYYRVQALFMCGAGWLRGQRQTAEIANGGTGGTGGLEGGSGPWGEVTMEESDQGGKRTRGGSGYFDVPIADTAAAARHRIRRACELAGLFATCTLHSAPTSFFPPSHTLPPPPPSHCCIRRRGRAAATSRRKKTPSVQPTTSGSTPTSGALLGAPAAAGHQREHPD